MNFVDNWFKFIWFVGSNLSAVAIIELRAEAMRVFSKIFPFKEDRAISDQQWHLGGKVNNLSYNSPQLLYISSGFIKILQVICHFHFFSSTITDICIL